MFTREALLPQIDEMLDMPMPPMERMKIESFGCEETIYACCGRHTDFKSAMFFWVKALQADGWSTGGMSILYVDRSKHLPITEADFFGLTQEAGSEHPLLPWFLQPGGTFRAGMAMTCDWNNQSALAEFDYGYVLFHWYTTV